VGTAASSISQIAHYTMDDQVILYWPHTWHPIWMMSLICQMTPQNPQVHCQMMPQYPQLCNQRALHPTSLSTLWLRAPTIFSDKLTNQLNFQGGEGFLRDIGMFDESTLANCVVTYCLGDAAPLSTKHNDQVQHIDRPSPHDLHRNFHPSPSPHDLLLNFHPSDGQRNTRPTPHPSHQKEIIRQKCSHWHHHQQYLHHPECSSHVHTHSTLGHWQP
jgi:hypothetical protein